MSLCQPKPAAPGLLAGDFEPLASPDTLDPLVVDRPARLAQQSSDLAIAIATVLPGQLDGRACAALGQHRSTQRKVPRGRDDEQPRVSSMCLPSKRIGWGYSSELSGSPERRPRSEWPILSTTSNALSSCATSPSLDRLVLRKSGHSSQYQIPIKLNQQPVSADLLHAENNSLIEPSSL
jgi:hypothetical protein